MTLRDEFVGMFGDTFTQQVEDAANGHASRQRVGDTTDSASDPFQWTLMVAIGYECMKLDDYRAYHFLDGAPEWDVVHKWMVGRAVMAGYDGGWDETSRCSGSYDPYVGEGVKPSEEGDRVKAFVDGLDDIANGGWR